MFEDGVAYQYIGNVTNAATDDTTLGKDIAVGSVALIKVDGSSSQGKVQETTMVASDAPFKIVQKTAAGQLIYSPEFYISKSTYSGKSYSAPVEQVTYYGYNGSTSSLGTVVSGQTYTLHITLRSYAPGVGHSPLVKTVPYVATSAVEADLATGLAGSFDRIFKREPNKTIQCDTVCNATVTAANGTKSGQEVTVVKGSTALTFETNVTYEVAGGATLAVGDYLRIGTVSGGTALTDPVYRVTAISTVYVTVDRPVTAASGIYDDAGGTSDIEVIPAATGNAADWGFKFTGLDRFADSGFNPQNDFFSKIRFEVASSDFDSTVATTASAVASEGVGHGYEVAQMESKLAMNDGKGKYASAYPATVYRGEADIATPGIYDTIVLNCYRNEVTSAVTGQQPVSKFQIYIRTKDALSGDAVDAAFGFTL